MSYGTRGELRKNTWSDRMIWMCPTCIVRPTKIIIKGVELKVNVCPVIKKKEEEEKKKKKQKISTRFVISTNNIIIWQYSKKMCQAT